MSNGSSVAGGGSTSSGDWICPDHDCRHLNFARRTQCNKCNRKKLGTEIGKAAAEKSRGLFSAEDWQCSKCANVNWARRQTCNICNAPKFSDIEERTGYGGGYNDRGVVEYKERAESDSEYDEFGRRKKRRGGQDDKKEIKKRKASADHDDEESEEEDGDGDLSKYDLWGSDNERPQLKNENDNKAEVENKIKSVTTNRGSSRRPSASSASSSSSSTSSVSSSSSGTSTSGSSFSSTTTSSYASNEKRNKMGKQVKKRRDRSFKRSNSLKNSTSRSRSPRRNHSRSYSRSRSPAVGRRRR